MKKARQKLVRTVPKIVMAVILVCTAAAAVISLFTYQEEKKQKLPVPNIVRSKLSKDLHISLNSLFIFEKDANTNTKKSENNLSLSDIVLYRYNKERKMTAEYKYDKNGWLYDYTNIFYDDYGSMLCTQTFDKLTGLEKETLYDNSYDKQGRLIRQIIYEQGKLDLHRHYNYEDNKITEISVSSKTNRKCVSVFSQDKRKLAEYDYGEKGDRISYHLYGYDELGRQEREIFGNDETHEKLQGKSVTEWDDKNYTSLKINYGPAESDRILSVQESRYTNDWKQTVCAEYEYIDQKPQYCKGYLAYYYWDENTQTSLLSYEMNYERENLTSFHLYQYRLMGDSMYLTTEYLYQNKNSQPVSTLKHHFYNRHGLLEKTFVYHVEGDIAIESTSGDREIQQNDDGTLKVYLIRDENGSILNEFNFEEEGAGWLSK